MSLLERSARSDWEAPCANSTGNTRKVVLQKCLVMLARGITDIRISDGRNERLKTSTLHNRLELTSGRIEADLVAGQNPEALASKSPYSNVAAAP